jgi:hypothetical protein
LLVYLFGMCLVNILDDLDYGFSGQAFAATGVCRLRWSDRCFGARCADWLRFVGTR